MSKLACRHLITLKEFSGKEITTLIESAISLKEVKRRGNGDSVRRTEGRQKHLALIFLRPSMRTQAAFSIAAADCGIVAHRFTQSEVRFGTGESIKDIARTFGTMFDAIAIRGYATSEIEAFSQAAGIPVWNAMSSEHHPTQALADLMTMVENGINLEGGKVAFNGHGEGNVALSLMIAAAKTGLDLTLIAPPGYETGQAMIDSVFDGTEHPLARITTTTDIARGMEGRQCVYADMWVHMDNGDDIASLTDGFAPYRITPALMALSGRDNTIFLHCLPSQHSLETEFARRHPYAIDTDDRVFEGPACRAFEQAENRLHTIKSLIMHTLF